MTQELRKLAKRLRKGQTHDFKTGYLLDQSDVMDESADAIDALLDRLEKAEKDAERWRNLCDLVNDERASVTFYGRLSTINTELEVHDSGDLHDELDIAMEASK